MFERDPIAVYKIFAEKRPAEMNCDDSPFYLTVKNLKKLESLSNNAWFIKKPHPVLTIETKFHTQKLAPCARA